MGAALPITQTRTPRLALRKAATLAEELAAIIEPPPIRTADVWADANRTLGPDSAEPGPFRTSRTPYMRRIMTSMSDPRVRGVVLITSTQSGKTDGVLNVIGQRLDDDPVPILAIFPTKDFAEDIFEPRLRRMFREVPSLWRKLAKGKLEKRTHKRVAGVDLRLGWASSASQLAGMPAGLVLIDERDRMGVVKGEGDPRKLAEARGRTFPGFKFMETSTPTIGNVQIEKDPTDGHERWAVARPDDLESPIWKDWQDGTRGEWAWPCPACGRSFVVRFTRLKWEGATPLDARETAHLECEWCDAAITDNQKTELNAQGDFLFPVEAAGSLVDSGWVSGLASPWQTFGDIAHDYLAAARAGDPDAMQAVINTRLGELYSVSGEAPDWAAVAAGREPYHVDQVPAECGWLTLGADVQKDRIYFCLRGWGSRMLPTALIRHGVLYGATEQRSDPVWTELEAVLMQTYDGRRIVLGLVDSGAYTHQVYDFCRRVKNAFPCKGSSRAMDQPFAVSRVDRTPGGKRIMGGLQLYTVNTDACKLFIYGRFEAEPNAPTRWRLYEEAEDDYCKQVTAEARFRTAAGKVVWKAYRANHYLDAEGYNVCAAYVVGMDRKDIPPQGPPGSGGGIRPLRRSSIGRPMGRFQA